MLTIIIIIIKHRKYSDNLNKILYFVKGHQWNSVILNQSYEIKQQLTVVIILIN